MQVAALQQFLRSLVPVLEAAGDGRAARSLSEATGALEPFRSLALPEFSAFLQRADEYQRTGTVRIPGAADLWTQGLATALDQVAAVRSGERGDMTAAQADAARAIEAVAREVGLKGSLVPDPQWSARARAAPHVRAIRDLASRITSPQAYGEESVRAEIGRLEGVLDRDSLTAVGAEFGVRVTPATKPAKLLADMLVNLSGHQPEKAKPGGRGKPAVGPVDAGLVEEHVRRLGNLISRSADPSAVSDTEVEVELDRLKLLPKPALVEAVSRAGVEGVKSRDALSAILQRVRNRLTAARRARERAEV